MGSSRGNNFFAKSRGKAAYDKRLSPNPRKAGSFVHRDCLFFTYSLERKVNKIYEKSNQ